MEAVQAGDDWRCLRCGQRWDAARLEAVTAYAAWVAAHEGVEGRRRSAATQTAAPFAGTVPGNDAKDHGDAIFTWDDEGGGPSSIGMTDAGTAKAPWLNLSVRTERGAENPLLELRRQ